MALSPEEVPRWTSLVALDESVHRFREVHGYTRPELLADLRQVPSVEVLADERIRFEEVEEVTVGLPD